VGIYLTNRKVTENEYIGKIIGFLRGDDTLYVNYDLVNGDGDVDNSRFEIKQIISTTEAFFALVLKAQSPDYEAEKNLSIRIKGTSANGSSSEHIVTLGVSNIEGPRAIKSFAPVHLKRGVSREYILNDYFDDPYSTGRIARINIHPAITAIFANSSLEIHKLVAQRPYINILLYDKKGYGATKTSKNFTSYVDDGSYANILAHRLVKDFVLQSGGFKIPAANAQGNVPIPSDDAWVVRASKPVENEYSPWRPNIRGTIAMAKIGGNPNSATNQWFLNLSDNTEILENQNEGFTTFGRTAGVEDLRVMDALAELDIVKYGRDEWAELPVVGDEVNNKASFLVFSNIEIIQKNELQFEVTQPIEGARAKIAGDKLLVEIAEDYTSDQPIMQIIDLKSSNQAGEITSQELITVIPATTKKKIHELGLADTIIYLQSANSRSKDKQFTNKGLVNVLINDDSHLWQYTLTGGKTWINGRGYFITLPSGVYEEGQIQVRARLGSNFGPSKTLAGTIVVDKFAALPPVLKLQLDTGRSNRDGITSTRLLSIESLELGSEWQLSLDRGISWGAWTRSDDSTRKSEIYITEGEYANGQIQARQRDPSGNISKISQLGKTKIDMSLVVNIKMDDMINSVDPISGAVITEYIITQKSSIYKKNIAPRHGGDVIYGDCEAGAIIKVINSGNIIGEAIGTQAGKFQIKLSAGFMESLENGTKSTFIVDVTDIAGNNKQVILRYSVDFASSTPGRDTLRGTPNKPDTFNLTNFSDSLLVNYDTILYFDSSDTINVGQINESNATLTPLSEVIGEIKSLTSGEITKLLNINNRFTSNSAIAFKVKNHKGTYIAVNDNIDGFQAGADTVLFLKNYNIDAQNIVKIT